MSVPFGEGAVLNDGRPVIAPWGKPGVWIGDSFVNGHQIRLPDAALTPSGQVWLVGVGQLGGVQVWSQATGWIWLSLTPFGTRTILRADGEGCRVAVATSASTWTCVGVSSAGTQTPISTGSIPLGGGGSGMRDWDAAGNPRPLDPVNTEVAGRLVSTALTAQDTTIALALGDLPDQVLLSKGGPLGTLQLAKVDRLSLRLSANAKFWIGTQFGTNPRVWTGAVPAVVPPLDSTAPIPAIGRPCWLGFFNFVPANTPGNCVLNTSDLKVRDAAGQAVAIYVAGNPESDLAALNTAIAKAKPLGLPIVAYWPRGLQDGPLPTGADWIGVEAYRGKAESLVEFEARLRACIKRVQAVQ